MDVRRATIVLAILTAFVLAGCSADRWVEVEPGEYVVANRAGTTNTTAPAEIQKLEIDRDKRLAIFTLVDESERVVSFAPRDRAVWPSGCPANFNSTRMEVLDIEENLLVIGSITLSNPILVRDCPPDPMRVVLREDGAIGGSGGACTHLNECILLRRGATSAPLPHSMKGYELYSWYAEQEGEWYYTLITATNRIKTYDEIVSPEVSVRGLDTLRSELDQLPSGEQVFWLTQRVPNMTLPPGEMIDEIGTYCRLRGIKLEIEPSQ